MRESGVRYGAGELVVWGVGLVVVLAVGIGLVALGFELGKRSRFSVASGEATATPTVPAGVFTPAPTSGAVNPTAIPTITPLPVGSPTDTPTASDASPMIVVDAEGTDVVNVRSGPGTNFSRVGQLNVGAQAPVTGRYADWWQIDYMGSTAWIYDGIVNASNVGNVPQVVPPPSPVPVQVQPTTPPQPTQPPPTQAPANARGLTARAYSVEEAPGPYGAGANIWFNFSVANTTGSSVQYVALGTVVHETGQYQKSWNYSEFTPNQVLTWRDHINIPAAGTYNLHLAVCFHDGECIRMAGPIVVTVQ